jgi:hypothetical protein
VYRLLILFPLTCLADNFQFKVINDALETFPGGLVILDFTHAPVTVNPKLSNFILNSRHSEDFNEHMPYIVGPLISNNKIAVAIPDTVLPE